MSFTIERVRHPLEPRLLEVQAVEELTPWLRRITLTGPLEQFASAAPDDHVKLVFPRGGETTIELPSVGPNGLGTDRSALPPMRDYTPRRFDAAARTLTIDMVVHGEGPGARWAATAAPGSSVGQLGPRGSARIAGTPDWLLLAGDEAAVPSITRRLEELGSGTAVIVRIEADAPGSLEAELAAALPEGADAQWIARDGAHAGERLVSAIRALELPGGDGYAWVGCEAEAARTLRKHLREERGLPKLAVKSTGYWRVGVSDHHDAPDEA